MGFDVELEELNDFLVDTCELAVAVTGAKDPISGKNTTTFEPVADLSTGLFVLPCRREPAVLNARHEDRKFVKNHVAVNATHRLWLREDVQIVETDNVIFNINGDGVFYDILFIEEFPDEIATQLKEVVLAQIRN